MFKENWSANHELCEVSWLQQGCGACCLQVQACVKPTVLSLLVDGCNHLLAQNVVIVSHLSQKTEGTQSVKFWIALLKTTDLTRAFSNTRALSCRSKGGKRVGAAAQPCYCPRGTGPSSSPAGARPGSIAALTHLSQSRTLP